GDFCDKYNINLDTAVGFAVPQELKDIPMFEFFNGETDSEGLNGVKRAMKQIKVSSIPAVLNMFPKEEGSNAIDQAVLDELANYNVTDLLDGEKGVAYVFQNICLADLLPDNFPAEDSENKLVWAMGQASIGKLYGALGAEQSLFLQVKPGGALEKLGQLKACDLLGSDETLQNILGEMLVADIVDETGSISLGNVISSVYLGSLLGNSRKEVDVETYVEIAEGIFQLGDAYAKVADGKYFEATLSCAEEHTHSAECYGFVWYSDKECTTAVTGIYQSLVNVTVADLMSGSSDTLLNTFKNVKLGDVMGESVSGILASFADMTVGELLDGGIDNVFLGSFLSYTRETVESLDGYTEEVANVMKNGSAFAKKDGETWYVAKLVCTETDALHTHDENCYGFVWKNGEVAVSGIMEKIANKKVNQLGNLSDMVMTLTIGEVLEGQTLTGVLGALKDVPINQISTEIDNIHLGTMLNYYRKAANENDYSTDVCENVKTDGTNFAVLDGETWYVAEAVCSETHTHTQSCFEFVWYTDEACTSAVSGIQKAFVNAKINTVGDVMNNLTLRKLGIGGNNILDAMQDVPLNDIGTEINNLKLGVIFGFVNDGGNWYEKCADGCGHAASEHQTLEGHEGTYTLAKGINSKMADKTVTELASGNGITDIVVTLTIGDLIDSGMMQLGNTEAEIAENEAKFNIMFCTDDSATFTEDVIVSGIVTGTKTYHCNLQDFLVYKATNSSITAQEYYDKFTHAGDCAGNWRDMQLADFISTLLDAIG
ncbi:MAG: hypothetical protein ACI4QL_01410, partial [Candidatus Fimimonas sp.]